MSQPLFTLDEMRELGAEVFDPGPSSGNGLRSWHSRLRDDYFNKLNALAVRRTPANFGAGSGCNCDFCQALP